MKTNMQIIGVAGTAGSGKDTVSSVIMRLFGLQNLSTSDMIRAITRQVYHLPPEVSPEREQLYVVGNFLRDEVDPATLVKLCILEGSVQGLRGGVVSGLRSMGEAEAIRNAGGIIIGVDADPKIRYDRIYARGRDAEAKKTFEEFLAQDQYENRGVSDQGPGRGIRSIIDSADVLITNASTLEELQTQVQQKVAPLLRPIL